MDIVLVILIIFLLTATVMMPRTFAIALPKAAQADKLESVAIIISIDREGHIAVNGPVKLAQDGHFDTVFTAQQQGKGTSSHHCRGYRHPPWSPYRSDGPPPGTEGAAHRHRGGTAVIVICFTKITETSLSL